MDTIQIKDKQFTVSIKEQDYSKRSDSRSERNSIVIWQVRIRSSSVC